MKTWFCKHEWELLSEYVSKSNLEHSMEALQDKIQGDFKLTALMSNPKRKLIQILICKKCGKLKRFVEVLGNEDYC